MTLVACGSATVAVAQPAAADQTVLGKARTITRTSWAYTDARHPTTSYFNQPGDAPVGAWRDARGKRHISRSYFTFDLTSLRGSVVTLAHVVATETAATDCANRSVEVWVTDPISAETTWRNPPKERAKLYTIGGTDGACPTPRLEADAIKGVREAVAAGNTELTLELRVTGRDESTVRLGRRFASGLQLYLEYDTPPTVGERHTGTKPCGSPAHISTTEPVLYAKVDDPDGDNIAATFAVWPVDAPDRRTELHSATIGSGGTARVTVPAAVMTDARTYAWAARASSGAATSPWSESCQVSVDVTPPANPPTVTSPDFLPDPEVPSGKVGVPGRFTFSADGDNDVVGFSYSDDGDRYTSVTADRPGGSASVTYTPRRPGTHRLYVRGVDRAGNSSPRQEYWFRVAA